MGVVRPNQISRSVLWWLGAGVAIVAASTYYLSWPASADDGGQPMPAAPTVEVTVVEQQQIRTWVSFSGRLAAVARAEVKPLVGGTIQQVLFDDGELVEAGQPLFIIDPRSHAAEVKRSQAQLASAKVREKLARDELARAEKLLQDKLVSRSQYDQVQSDQQVAEAAVSEAAAALQQAELNFDYAHIRAPVAGRIGRAELTQGNVVEAGGNAPILATIVSHDVLYAEFNVDEQTYVQFARGAQAAKAMPVRLVLEADTSAVYEGHLHAFDNHIDTTTGTIRARAIFENSDGFLMPGMYAIVQLGSPTKMAALVIPERAIGTNQDKKFAYVVDENNIAQYRELTLGKSWNGQRIINGGLEPGDKVIVNGLSHVRPATPVNPVISTDGVAVADSELKVAEESRSAP